MYKITNTGSNPRQMMTAFGPLVVPPRESRDRVVLSDSVAKHLRRCELRKQGVHIEGMNRAAEAVLDGALNVRRGFVIAPPEQLHVRPDKDELLGSVDAPQPEADLLAGNDAPHDQAQTVEGSGGPAAGAKRVRSENNRLTTLLSKIDDMQLGRLRNEAREALGDKWPGGTPSRRQIEAAIRETLDGVHGSGG